MRKPHPLLPLLLAAGCAGAGMSVGCVSQANDAAVYSNGAPLPSSVPPSDTPTYSQPDAPSISGLDRSAWPKTDFVVTQREVEHQTLYRSKPVSLTHASAVQRHEYPTPETAGEDVTDGSRGDQALEALLAPLQACADVLLMIPRVIMTLPETPARGPTAPVERVPPRPAAPTPPTTPAPQSAPPEPVAPSQPVPPAAPATTGAPR